MILKINSDYIPDGLCNRDLLFSLGNNRIFKYNLEELRFHLSHFLAIYVIFNLPLLEGQAGNTWGSLYLNISLFSFKCRPNMSHRSSPPTLSSLIHRL